MARTSAIGLRRGPQPPMPMVMPSWSSATTSSMVIRLSRVYRWLTRFSFDEASRSSSETPARLSSKVKPCSKR